MARASRSAHPDGLDDVETVAVAKAHVDDGIGRRRLFDFGQTVGNRFGGGDGKASALHGAGKTLQKQPIVIDDQQAFVRAEFA